MDILVTGASGLVGTEVVPRLQAQGHRVLLFTGDVRDATDVDEQVEHARAVLHLAAVLDETDSNAMREVNIEGTRNILAACEKHRVKRLVLVSSVGVHGNINGTIDEDAAIQPESEYEKTKAEAEKIALEYLESVPLTIVRPALVLGPNEYWRGIVGKIKSNFPLIGSGQNTFQIVSVDDLADGLVFLLETPEAIGETYIVAEEKGVTLNEIVQIIKGELKITKPTMHVPYFLGMAMAYVSLGIGRLTGKKPLLIPRHVERLVRTRAYSIEKIKKLGWRPSDDTKTAIQKMMAELNETKATG
jgi:nucleoside-diphosphate-sugar epimerase